MLLSKARWKISEIDSNEAEKLATTLNIDPIIAKLLMVRGITEPGQADEFLNGSPDHFHDPFLLDGMSEAVERIRSALERKEKIRIYGDYDADGVSSTSLMIFLLRRLGADFDYYIPHRVNEGYGLNREAIDHAKRSGIALIITVDTGISAREEIAYASGLGIDTIVTDHHEPPELLPEAVAVINPKKPGCPYPFKELAGVGVAFKLAHGLLGTAPLELLEIAAIGTVADLMPLVGENRLIVRLGLEQLRGTANTGLKALIGVAGIEKSELTATHIGFALAPRINASGRLDTADHAVQLLVTGQEQEAESLAFELDQLNKERQKIVDETVKEALRQIGEKGYDDPARRVLVLAEEGWNPGVIGIVASKILEKFYRPTIIFSIDPETGVAKGSARSIPGFDIYRALTACSELFDHFGGHQAAAGMSLHRDRIDELRDSLEQIAGEWLQEDELIPILEADLSCSLPEAPLEYIRQIERLAPFGMGNPSPRFVFQGLKLNDKKIMGKDRQHLKLVLSSAAAKTACTMEAVGFGYGPAAGNISPTAEIDVFGELSVNEWNGMRRAQIIIQDMRIPRPQVFDWRGGKAPAERYAGDPAKLSVLICDQADLDLLPAPWVEAGCGIWLAQEKEEPVLVNGNPDRAPFGAVKDLVLYTLPHQEEQLSSALRSAASAERIYAVFQEPAGNHLTKLPARDGFKIVYAAISKQESFDWGDAGFRDVFSKRTGLSRQALQFILDVFEELGFVEREGAVYRRVASPAKRDLTESNRYQGVVSRQHMEQGLIFSSGSDLTDYLLAYLNKY